MILFKVFRFLLKRHIPYFPEAIFLRHLEYERISTFCIVKLDADDLVWGIFSIIQCCELVTSKQIAESGSVFLFFYKLL